MRVALLTVSIFFSLCFAAGAKERQWQDAKVAKIDMTETRVESEQYRSSAPSGQAGTPVSSGAETRVVRIYTYKFKVGDKTISGSADKKPIEGVKEGDDIKVCPQRGGFLYVLPAGGKERRLDTVKE